MLQHSVMPHGQCMAGRATQQLAAGPMQGEGDRKGCGSGAAPVPRLAPVSMTCCFQHQQFNTLSLRAVTPPPLYGMAGVTGIRVEAGIQTLAVHFTVSPFPNLRVSPNGLLGVFPAPSPKRNLETGFWMQERIHSMMITAPSPPMHIGLIGKKEIRNNCPQTLGHIPAFNNNLYDFLLCCYRASMQTSNASVFPSRKWVQQSLPCPALPHRAVKAVQ